MQPDLTFRLVRIARSLEAGEIYYNAAKLSWATAFSSAVELSNRSGLLQDEELVMEMKSVVDELRKGGALQSVIEAWTKSVDTISKKGYLSLAEVPETQVCRRCGRIHLGVLPTRCPTCGSHRLTFKDFPVPWWPEPMTPTEALEALRSAPGEVAGAIENMPDELMARKPSPDEWSVRDVLAHLLSSNITLTERIRLMIDKDDPPLENITVGQQASNAGITGSETFRQYRDSRSETLGLLEHLPVEGWYRSGHHTGIGTKTVLHQASYFTKHERLHVPHIEQIRTALKP